MISHDIYHFLSDISLTMRISWSIHVAVNGGISFIFMNSILHCTCVPLLLYPFVCHWILKLLPYLGFCKQCCSEPWHPCIFLNNGFLWIYVFEWDCWLIWQFCIQIFKEPEYSPSWLYPFTFPPVVQESSLYSSPSPVFIVCRFFDDGRSFFFYLLILYWENELRKI